MGEGYFYDVLFFSLLAIYIVNMTSKTLLNRGVKIFDSTVRVAFLGEAIVWLPTLLLQIVFFLSRNLSDYRLESNIIFIWQFIFVFLIQAIIINKHSLLSAFKNNFKVLLRNIVKVVVVMTSVFILNKVFHGMIRSLLPVNHVLPIIITPIYYSIRFIVIKVIFTVIYIDDLKTHNPMDVCEEESLLTS